MHCQTEDAVCTINENVSDDATNPNTDAAEISTASASETEEVFETPLSALSAVPKTFKSSYARRLSLNSSLPT